MNKDEMYADVAPYVSKHWARMCRIWPELRAHTMPKLVINARIYKTAGCCDENGTYVELSLRLYQAQDNRRKMLIAILAHELIHAADRLLNGEWYEGPTKRQPHGPIWKRMMIEYGLPANPYHNLRMK